MSSSQNNPKNPQTQHQPNPTMAASTSSIPSTPSNPTSPPPATITCPDPDISSLEKHGYLFGHPIAHSMSSLLHQTVFDRLGLKWSQKFLPSTDLSQFLRLVKNPDLYGSAVTMPHKVSILPHLDSLTEECRAVGACNTVFRDPGDAGKLVGGNTDTVGIRDAFLNNLEAGEGEGLAGRPGLVIGGGGAARSACYALVRLMGFGRVYLVNRDEREVREVVDWCRKMGYGEGLRHVRTKAEAEELEGPGAVVACIPDIEPKTEAEWEVRGVVETFLRKEGKGAWLEMAYHPSPWTRLAGLAEGAGWRVILGTEAMIYQGLKQHSYWHGREIGEELVREVKEVVARELSKSKL